MLVFSSVVVQLWKHTQHVSHQSQAQEKLVLEGSSRSWKVYEKCYLASVLMNPTLNSKEQF